ncbi:MAG: hypothetical protein U0P45_03570 [Acidimicrobiales bacterium]
MDDEAGTDASDGAEPTPTEGAAAGAELGGDDASQPAASAEGTPDGAEDGPGSVSRRSFIKAVVAVGGTVAAGALLWKIIGDDDSADDAAKVPQAKLNGAPAPETKTLHFALGSTVPADDAVLLVAGKPYPLQPYGGGTTTTSIAKATTTVATTALATTTTAIATTIAGSTPTSDGSAPTTSAPASTTAAPTTTAPTTSAPTTTAAATTTTGAKVLGSVADELQGVDASLFSHYVPDVELPETPVHAVLVDGLSEDGYITPDTRYLGAHLHVPSGALVAAATQAQKRQLALRKMATDASFREVVAAAAVGAKDPSEVKAALAAMADPTETPLLGSKARWDRLGSSGPADATEALALTAAVENYHETALGLVMNYPELIKGDTDSAAKIKSRLATADFIDDLAAELADRVKNRKPMIGTFQAVKDETGTAVNFPVIKDANNQESPTVAATTLVVDEKLLPYIGTAVSSALTMLKSDPDLENVVWVANQAEPPPPVVEGSGDGPLQLGGIGDVSVSLTGDGVNGSTAGISVKLGDVKKDPTTGTLQVTLTVGNDFLRHVTLAVAMQTSANKGVSLKGLPYGAAASFFENMGQEDDKYALGVLTMLTSAPSVFGVIVPGVNSTDVTIKFAEEAATASLHVLGWGMGLAPPKGMDLVMDQDGAKLYGTNVNNFWAPHARFGNCFTMLFDMVFPTLMLLMNGWSMRDISKDVAKEVINGAEDAFVWTDEIYKEVAANQATAVKIAAGVATGTAGAAVLADVNTHDSVFDLVKSLALSILAKPAGKIAELMWEQAMIDIGTETALKCMPFVGQGLAVAGVIGGTLQVAQTAADLAVAPSALAAQIVPTYSSTVTILPDDGSDGTSGDAALPSQASHYVLTPHVFGREVPLEFKGTMTPGSLKLDIPVANVPLGGLLRWHVELHTDEGWLVGQGNSEWESNWDPDTASKPRSITITEIAVPVTSSSSLKRTKAMEGTSSAVTWDTGAAASTGSASQLVDGDPAAFSELDSITVSTNRGVAGYVWKSDGQWYVRNASVVGEASSAWNGSGGFAKRPLLAYDPLTADAKGEHCYLLDPDPKGGYFVRRVSIEAGTNMITSPGQAYGRVPIDLDDLAFHPSGILVGLSSSAARLVIIPLLPTAVPDAEVPFADLAAGPRARDGLLTARVRDGHQGRHRGPRPGRRQERVVAVVQRARAADDVPDRRRGHSRSPEVLGPAPR